MRYRRRKRLLYWPFRDIETSSDHLDAAAEFLAPVGERLRFTLEGYDAVGALVASLFDIGFPGDVAWLVVPIIVLPPKRVTPAVSRLASYVLNKTLKSVDWELTYACSYL